jgi:hypothetical protein
MDVSQLAQTLTLTLAPCLPYLLKLSDKAAEEAAKHVGVDVWERAKLLWSKLHPTISDKPTALEAVHDVANASQDEDAIASLRLQIKKLLTENEPLARQVAEILGHDIPHGDSTIITQTAGDDAFQIGQARDITVQRG